MIKDVASDNSPKMTREQHDELIKNLNVDKILEQTKDQRNDAIIESMSNDRAAREPIPTVVENVFTNEPLTIKLSTGKEVTIRPMVAFDINIFKLVNSPFYRIIMGDQDLKNGAGDLFADEEEGYELIYQFTHPCKEVYQLYKKGREIFRDKVIEDIGCEYNLIDAGLLIKSIMNHVFHVNMTRIQFAGPVSDDEDKKKLIQEKPVSSNSPVDQKE